MRQPTLKHTQIVRLARFLDMMYRPSEVAEEIGVTQDTVYRSYLPAGLHEIITHLGSDSPHSLELKVDELLRLVREDGLLIAPAGRGL